MRVSETSMALSPWQKKQAALLYHFASLDYLKIVKKLVDALLHASLGARHAANGTRLKGRRNAHRDTGNIPRVQGVNGSTILAHFELRLAEDVADRARDAFNVTGRYDCSRMIAEFATEWTSPAGSADFHRIFSETVGRASNIDATMSRDLPNGLWTDFDLAIAWRENFRQIPNFPNLQVREDIFAESGSVPTRTGVYVRAADPNASLQFAWTGRGDGKLLQCSTFNELGEAALAAVGREGLWFDEQAMLDFVVANQDSPELRSDSFFADSQTAALAPSLVARQAFTAKPCKWYYVEKIDGEFEAANIGV